jgi:glycosyltransferase involved in cell wall biosynthesis
MRSPSLCVVIPVFNEEAVLAESVERLVRHLGQTCSQRYEIVIANNGSTDRTLEIARALAEKYRDVRVLHLEEKGRGRALKTAWLESAADVLAYMDADLSSDIGEFPALIEPLANGRHDVAIGSRLLNSKLTTRCFKRELASRVYNLLHRTLLHTAFRDAQCGFKAITRKAAQGLLPSVQDTNWFFDTELLVLAQRRGYRIFELPVRWVENRNTHVKLMATAVEDLRGLWRIS